MEINFKGKKALVTGAAGEIGKAIAIKLLDLKAHVVALDNNAEGLELLKTQFPKIEVVCVDLQDWASTIQIARDHPDVDLLVNCAASFSIQPTGEVDEESLDRLFSVNVKAVINLTQEVIKGMMIRGSSGSIVNVSSQASSHVIPGHLSYSLSKAALDMVTKYFANTFVVNQIRTNSVNPGAVATTAALKWHQGRKGEASQASKVFIEKEEVANAVAFLLSDKASAINGHLMLLEKN